MTPEALREDLRRRVFRSDPSRVAPGRATPGGAGAGGVAPGGIGAEVELIPVDAETGAVVPVRGSPGRSMLELLLAHGCPRGWARGTSAMGSPRLALPDGGVVSFEPGGQVEISSPVLEGVDALSRWLLGVVGPLRDEARERGIVLLSRGFDPVNPAAGASLHLDGERYRRQAAHYDRRGPWGRRMMRQSAAIHLNLDFGDDAARRWRVANRAAPLLLAAFANSPRAEGMETGHRSWRAAQWRRLDPGRTGVFGASGDPVDAYLEFALGADAFLLGPEDEAARPFRHWLGNGVTPGDWRRHLSTLFPEVRPRGYLELRFFDAVPPAWYPAVLAVTAGLLYDRASLAEAERLLAPPSGELLERCGRDGVRDPVLREGAAAVLGIGIEGAKRLGGAEGSVEVAEAFLQGFTAAGRDPGDGPEA